MDLLRGLVALALIYLSVGTATASNCPAFSGPEVACSETTCGHYVFKGRFSLQGAQNFRVPAAKNGLRLGKSASPADCCARCREQSACMYWNFFAKSGACYLYTEDLCKAGQQHAGQAVYVPKEPNSYVGGKCKGALPSVANAVGAAGMEKLPEKSFCLITDTALNVNMQLSGYLDNRTAAAGKSARKVRVWIREMGFMWRSAAGKIHAMKIIARRTAQQERGDGFLDHIEVDGSIIPRLMLGDELNLFDGQASVLFDAYEKEGPYDVDVYSVRVENMLEAQIRLRPVHPLLQLPGDAMVHINLDVNDMGHSPDIHGVLGQSYRSSQTGQTLDYSVLSALMMPPKSSPAASVLKLEGTAADYVASDTLIPDCKVSKFSKILTNGEAGKVEQEASEKAAIGMAHSAEEEADMDSGNVKNQ